MRVSVHDHYSGVSRSFEGSRAEVYNELLRNYPWLHDDTELPNDVEGMVEALDATQVFEAEVDDFGGQDVLAKGEGNLASREVHPDSPIVLDMLGYDHHKSSTFDAARHLVRGNAPSLEQVRRALWEANGDAEEAALRAHGIEVNEGNLRALRAVRDMTSVAKADGQPIQARSVEPGTTQDSDAAEAVMRAFKDSYVLPVQMAGKHSQGTLLARDVQGGDVYLLKPGSGGNSPAAGVTEEQASQSRRDAAFWAVAERWGVQNNIPETRLIFVDGKEYACITLLPWRYKTVEKMLKTDPSIGRRLLEPLLSSGLIFRWAVLDFVLGNPDRHANNMMADTEEAPGQADVKLIDQGSAMAGVDFDPAHDKNSFVPYYLRAWAPMAFNQLSTEEKLRVMPKLNSTAEEDLSAWLDNLHADDLTLLLTRYGVNPEPAVMRLAKLKALTTEHSSDEAVNKLWVET